MGLTMLQLVQSRCCYGHASQLAAVAQALQHAPLPKVSSECSGCHAVLEGCNAASQCAESAGFESEHGSHCQHVIVSESQDKSIKPCWAWLGRCKAKICIPAWCENTSFGFKVLGRPLMVIVTDLFSVAAGISGRAGIQIWFGK